MNIGCKQGRQPMTEREWDLRLGIRTTGREDESGVRYAPYEPTPYPVLLRLADSGWLRTEDHLLDYGCGKGRAAIFLAAMVGCRATGIDRSRKLIDVAEENRRSSHLETQVSFVCAPAEHFCPQEENAFFFFNPFSEKIFAGVLRRLDRLCREKCRVMKLFCYYPSREYLACLGDVAGSVRLIDCGDLFGGRDPRECIAAAFLGDP